MRPLITLVLLSNLAIASDLSLTIGGQVTPDKIGLSSPGPQGQRDRVAQTSKPAPSFGFQYRQFLTKHFGFVAEASLTPTNTQLGHSALYIWQMERMSINGSAVYRITNRRVSPFIRVGGGTLVTIGGHTKIPGDIAGTDIRAEEIAAVGFDYNLLKHVSLRIEYIGHFTLNPDFSDHSWKPQHNLISEPKLGLTYTF